MGGRAPTDAETAAADAVANELGGAVVPRDVPGAPDGTHDFDIELPDRTVSLEVTAIADGHTLSYQSALLRPWEPAQLRKSWLLVVDERPATRVVKFKKEMEATLMSLEGQNVTRLAVKDGPQQTLALEQARQTMQKWGVKSADADALSAVPCPAVCPVPVSAGTGNISELNARVEAEITPNMQKLVKATGDERHLFVWLTPSVRNVELAVSTGVGPPDSPPTLPPELDAVWLATQGAQLNTVHRLMRVRRGADWEVLR